MQIYFIHGFQLFGFGLRCMSPEECKAKGKEPTNYNILKLCYKKRCENLGRRKSPIRDKRDDLNQVAVNNRIRLQESAGEQ